MTTASPRQSSAALLSASLKRSCSCSALWEPWGPDAPLTLLGVLTWCCGDDVAAHVVGKSSQSTEPFRLVREQRHRRQSQLCAYLTSLASNGGGGELAAAWLAVNHRESLACQGLGIPERRKTCWREESKGKEVRKARERGNPLPRDYPSRGNRTTVSPSSGALPH